MSRFGLGALASYKDVGMPGPGKGLLLGRGRRQDVTTQEALFSTSTDSEENDSDLCFEWEPWSKGPAEFRWDRTRCSRSREERPCW